MINEVSHVESSWQIGVESDLNVILISKGKYNWDSTNKDVLY